MMANDDRYSDLLKEFDPLFVPEPVSSRADFDSVDAPKTATSVETKRNALTLPKPAPSKLRPATPVICIDGKSSSLLVNGGIGSRTSSTAVANSVSSQTNTAGIEETERHYFHFFRPSSAKDENYSNVIAKNKAENRRSLAFADLPIDGNFFIKVNVTVLCFPGQPTFEFVESIQITVSDLICMIFNTVDNKYNSGILSTAVGFELHCAQTNECLSGNGKLCEYRVFERALRFSLEPVHLVLAVAREKVPGDSFTFQRKNELTSQKTLERALTLLDSQLKLVSNPWEMQASTTPSRQILQTTANRFREVEQALGLQHTSIFRRIISHFEKLASSVVQSQNLTEISKKSAKSVSKFVNAYTEAFNVPFTVHVSLGGTASSYSESESLTTASHKRGRLSLTLSSLHRFLCPENQLQVSPIYVECLVCDVQGNAIADIGSISFTFEHKLKCSQPNTITFISNDDDYPLFMCYLDCLSPPVYLAVRVYSVLPMTDQLSRSSSSVADRSLQQHSALQQYRTLVSWANFPLFDDDGCLKSGLKIIPLWPRETFTSLADNSSCFCSNMNDATCQVIVARFHTDHPIYAKTKITINPYLSFAAENPMPTSVEERLYKSLYSDLCNFTEEDKSFFWSTKQYLKNEPKALPIVLWCAAVHSPQIFNETVDFLNEWSALPEDPLSIMRLLLPELANPIVTEVLVAILLHGICSDSAIDLCLPQFIQSLRLHGWKLAEALVKRCSENHELSVTLYWLLSYEANNCDSVCCRTMYSALSLFLRSKMTGTAMVEEITHQMFAVRHVMAIAEKIYNAKSSGKNVDLQRELENFIRKQRFELPNTFTFPCIGGADTRLSGLDPQGCAVLASRAAPLRLKFVLAPDVDSSTAPLMCIVKVGDDLRNDLVALQLVRIMDYIWMSCELDLRVITFRVLPTDSKQGIIEFVPDVDQLRVAQGGLSKHALIDWFTGREKQLDPVVIDTFTRTCAAWCVASYLIGVGDRHNDNILLKRSTGHLFHIDFGRLFGDAEKIAGVRRDRVPFVFTDAMAMLIAGGQEFGQEFAQAGFRQFVDTCCLAFNLVRRRGESFILSAVRTLRFPPKNITYLRECLMLSVSDAEAGAAFEKMIRESLRSVAPQFNFFIHNIAQSFVKQPPVLPSLSQPTKATRSYGVLNVPPESLDHASVTEFHKVRYPVKHYMFQISVYPGKANNVTLSTGGGPFLIFRRFSEVNDLRENLTKEFPVISQQLPSFKTPGATENRDMARKRMGEINSFLGALFSLSLEIRRSQSLSKFFMVRPLDLRWASGFVQPTASMSGPVHECQVWMTVTLKNPESPICEVFVHRGINCFYDENVTGRARVTLIVKDDAKGSEFSVNGPSKYRTDLAPPGSQPLFNKLFQWKLPVTDKWPVDLALHATVKVHPTNSSLSLLSSTATDSTTHAVRQLGTVRISLIKIISWATSWPIVDTQYFKLGK